MRANLSDSGGGKEKGVENKDSAGWVGGGVEGKLMSSSSGERMDALLRHGHVFVDKKENILELHRRGYGGQRLIDHTPVPDDAEDEKNIRIHGIYRDPEYEAMVLLDEEVENPSMYFLPQNSVLSP